ncbi:TPA: TIR domain-containing protein [Vibrio parahaemolyticus]
MALERAGIRPYILYSKKMRLKMALDSKEQRVIERYFDMGTGYVLNYSNRTFSQFFDQFNIDIYDNRYSDLGTSKANRLRSFFKQHSDSFIGQILLEMIAEYDIERQTNPYSYTEHDDDLRQNCIKIANLLKQSSAPAQPPQGQLFENPFKASAVPTSFPRQRTNGWGDNTQSTTPNQVPQNSQPTTVEQFVENSVPSHYQPVTTNVVKERVFIVHGHDEHLLVETENLCRKLNLEPIILKDQYSGGKTIIEKLEVNSDVKYAVILYTACDEGRQLGSNELKKRARQNVVFEHGYFIGSLGRGNVAAVVKGSVEIQGDISGVVYIPHQNGWQYQLAKEMKHSGLTVDLNHV